MKFTKCADCKSLGSSDNKTRSSVAFLMQTPPWKFEAGLNDKVMYKMFGENRTTYIG